MLRLLSPLFILLLCTGVRAQQTAVEPLTYSQEDGDVHLAGPHTVADLQREPFAEWFMENASATILPEEVPAWAADLDDVKVTIFLGTWCGDSKVWVPRFLTLWKALGHDESQLELISLYDYENRYKQGPDHEEAGNRIHRVPTFIFEREDQEIARIVERPVTDLTTDLAQIALGYPVSPRYAAANYLLRAFAESPADTVVAELNEHYRTIYRDISSTGELNTLGNVFRYSDRAIAAYAAFRINAAVFPYDPRSLRQFASIARDVEEKATALLVYERLLTLVPDDEEALAAVAELRAETPEEEEK